MNNSTLNTQHKVTLTEGQISTILYIMEGYINPSDDYSYDPEFREDVDNIFAKLEEVADSWEGEFADPKVLDRSDIVVDTFSEDNYKDKVDSLVDRMKSTK